MELSQVLTRLLVALSGTSRVLVDRAGRADDLTRRKHFEVISAHCDDLIDLATSVLGEAERIDTGEGTPEPHAPRGRFAEPVSTTHPVY